MKKVKTQIDVTFDNQYKEFQVGIEEDEILDIAKELCKFFLSKNDVIEKSALKNFKFNKISFELVFVNNETIHEINRDYRQKDHPTDVITFALFADSEPKFVYDGEISLGEIIVSLDKIEEQAKEIGNEFKDELYYIISHGILHLFGFDHISEEEYNFMVGLQKESLKEVYV